MGQVARLSNFQQFCHFANGVGNIFDVAWTVILMQADGDHVLQGILGAGTQAFGIFDLATPVAAI